MKKSLIAVAVAAALPTIALAQTNVTMYGIADAGIGMQDRGGDAKSAIVVSSGLQSTSRFGIRGTEDLGGGLKAVFNFEAGMRVDDGTAAGLNFTRRSVVGFQGGFGTISLGRDYTPGFTAAGATDVMGYGLYGNYLGYTVVGALNRHGSVFHGIETRASNAVHYMSPNMGGLTVRAMWSVGERTAAPSRGGDIMGVSAVYAGGPLTVQGYYQQLKGINGTSTTNNNQFGIGAGYNFGAFRLTASYAVADPSGDNNKHSGISVGAGVKLGAGEVLAQVIQQKVATGGTEPKSTTIGVAYVHPLSRRTNVYATYGQTRNNSTGNFALRGADETIAPNAVGNDPKAFSVGVRHTF